MKTNGKGARVRAQKKINRNVQAQTQSAKLNSKMAIA